eukprot:gene6924-11087_t
MKFVIFFFVAYFVALSQQELVVDTEYGKVSGIEKPKHFEYLGIPFASPPVKELRFASPRPAKSWSPNVYQATKQPAGCAQRCFLPPGTCPDKVSEDCLYLNVYSPKKVSKEEKLPVLVYIHGGNFIQGNPGAPIFDAGILCEKAKAVVVLISYRLGSFGFLFDDTNNIKGNFGLDDQRLAMQFVQRNIGNFGGDSKRVTLGGQSAGASSVAAHLVSDKSNNLFHKAVVESNPITIPWKRPFSAVATAKHFYKNLTCSDIDCLRNKPMDAILDAQIEAGKQVNISEFLHTFMAWTPVIDGEDIKTDLMDAMEKGQFKKMPMIFGVTADESIIFIRRGFQDKLNDVKYLGLLYSIFGRFAFNVVQKYPPFPVGGDKRLVLDRLANDYVFFGPNRYLMKNINKHNPHGVYYWYFNRPMSFDGWGPIFHFCKPLACHGINVLYLFQSIPKFTPDELETSNQMIQYYANFIHNDNPSVTTFGKKPKVEWPKFNMETKLHLQFDKTEVKVGKNLHEKKCDFWDRMGYKFGTPFELEMKLKRFYAKLHENDAK